MEGEVEGGRGRENFVPGTFNLICQEKRWPGRRVMGNSFAMPSNHSEASKAWRIAVC